MRLSYIPYVRQLSAFTAYSFAFVLISYVCKNRICFGVKIYVPWVNSHLFWETTYSRHMLFSLYYVCTHATTHESDVLRGTSSVAGWWLSLGKAGFLPSNHETARGREVVPSHWPDTALDAWVRHWQFTANGVHHPHHNNLHIIESGDWFYYMCC